MATSGYEPASGYNLPPGCFEDDIERAFGGDEAYCGSCTHCIESDELDCSICEAKLKHAMSSLKGSQRWLPEFILSAVEEAVIDEGDCCEDWEEA